MLVGEWTAAIVVSMFANAVHTLLRLVRSMDTMSLHREDHSFIYVLLFPYVYWTDRVPHFVKWVVCMFLACRCSVWHLSLFGLFLFVLFWVLIDAAWFSFSLSLLLFVLKFRSICHHDYSQHTCYCCHADDSRVVIVSFDRRRYVLSFVSFDFRCHFHLFIYLFAYLILNGQAFIWRLA